MTREPPCNRREREDRSDRRRLLVPGESIEFGNDEGVTIPARGQRLAEAGRSRLQPSVCGRGRPVRGHTQGGESFALDGEVLVRRLSIGRTDDKRSSLPDARAIADDFTARRRRE